MKTTNIIDEERNARRVILLGSTCIVIIVSIIVGYVLINSEIKDFKEHLKIFRTTLIQREKAAVKAVVNNLISDIKYDEKAREIEIKRRVKNQTLIVLGLIDSKNDSIKSIKEKISNLKNKNIEFFIYKNDGTLLYDNKSKLQIGNNYIDLEDIDGKHFIKDIVSISGFIDYKDFTYTNHIISKKFTYSVKIPTLDIVIGSSEFLYTKYTLNKNIIEKFNKENFGKNDFIFINEIMSLSSSKNYSKLVLEKNIVTDDKELLAIENILEKSDYKGNIFYQYDNKLIYSSFLSNNKTFISAGVNLESIKNIIKKETEISNKNLNKKIFSLVINLIIISLFLFLFSYFFSKKIEKMFKNYRIKISKSQQLLIQKSKMESMGEMIGNIAHQWRQPLSQLSGVFLDIESAHRYNELNEKYLAKRVDQANDLLEYMSKTIDDFKEFYNPNAKKKKFNIKKSTQSAINIVGPSLEFHKINLEVDIDKSLHVEGFCNEFSQVILNLLSNSRDMAILKQIKNPTIRIYTQIDHDKILLHVIDNCGGIDKDNLEKIFEPYFTTKYTYGTGIGLYMCKVIIENKMNGKIIANNLAPNKSKFTITLTNCY